MEPKERWKSLGRKASEGTLLGELGLAEIEGNVLEKKKFVPTNPNSPTQIATPTTSSLPGSRSGRASLVSLKRHAEKNGMEDMLDKRFNNAFETMRNSANFTVLAESQAGTDEGLDLLKDAMEQKSKDGLNIKFDSKPFNIKIYSRGQRMMKRHKDRDIFNFEFFEDGGARGDR